MFNSSKRRLVCSLAIIVFLAAAYVLAQTTNSVTTNAVIGGNVTTIFTFYVDPSGSDSANGSLATPWQTVAKVNATTLTAGQSVGFKRGGTWREALTPTNSGSAGNPITFGAYGSGAQPIINGSDIITGWSTDGQANVYDATVTTSPNQVFSNGVRLTKAASKIALTDQQWFWAANVLNFQSNAGNPDTLGLAMEASSRNNGIKLNSLSYVTVSGLAVTKANLTDINIGSSATDHLTITGNTLTYAAEDAIVIFSGAAGLTNGLITQNTMAWNGAQGVYLLGPTSANNTISSNTIDHNCQIYSTTAPLVDNQFCGGIRFLADLGAGNVITLNTVTNTGYLADNTTPTSGTNATGVGIWLDCGVATGAMASTVISYNTISNGAFDGIRLEDCSGETVIYNVSYGNIRSTPQSGGITMGSYNHVHPTSGNVVYNNTLYGNRIGLNLLGYSTGGAGAYTNNLIRNNLAVGSLTHALQADYGADNDGTMGSGNIYTYNGFGVQSTNFIQWGGAFNTNFQTYAAWQGGTGAGVGVTDNYMASDPLFTNTAAANFTLQGGSPALAAGLFIAGISTSNPPNLGAK